MIKTKKEKIFDAVFEKIYEDGNIANIKVSDIAKRAGIGKGSVYMYFASKEQMLFEAAKYLVESTISEIVNYKCDKDCSFEHSFKGFLNEHIKATKKYSSLFNATLTTVNFPQFTSEFRKMMVKIVLKVKIEYIDALKIRIKKGAEEGIISDQHTEFELLAAAHMLFSTSGHFCQIDMPILTDDLDEYIQMQYNMAIKMLK